MAELASPKGGSAPTLEEKLRDLARQAAIDGYCNIPALEKYFREMTVAALEWAAEQCEGDYEVVQRETIRAKIAKLKSDDHHSKDRESVIGT